MNIKLYFNQTTIQNDLKEMLWNNTKSFMTSLMSIVSSSDLLSKADPQSVYNAAIISVSLWLPINPNLWYSYIIPYQKKKKVVENWKEKWIEDWLPIAQFQIWYKWIVQLALRSKEYRTISVSEIRDWQIISSNPLTWYEFDFSKEYISDVIWYVWYFKLLNWFEKVFYMNKKDILNHAKEYSQQFKRLGTWLWSDKFDEMAKKTILKLMLSKFWVLSIEMQKAIIADQWVISSEEDIDIIDWVDYPDNEKEINMHENDIDQWLLDSRIDQLNDCDTIEKVNQLYNQNKPVDKTILSLFTARKNELSSI